jgi:hypothetical protein
MPGKTIIKGHYGLNLRGWGRFSIWGVDGREGHLFAQLWRDDDDGQGDPHVWVTPPKWPETRDLTELARQIARATGASEDDAANAIAESLGWTHRDSTGA